MIQGEIWLIKFPPATGHEYSKDRPALIVQGNSTIKESSVYTVLPFTSNTENKLSKDIPIKRSTKNKLYCDSLLKVQHFYSCDRSRFIRKIGEIEKEILKRVKNYIKIHFSLS